MSEIAKEPLPGAMENGGEASDQDEAVLNELGYKQELRRDWGLMHNFGISFSIIVSYFSIANSLKR